MAAPNSVSRSYHFAAEGLRPQEVEIAPEVPENTHSKRYELINKEDKRLERNLTELEIGTKARNRAFQERLDEVCGKIAGFEAKLKTEARESVESINTMREAYDKEIAAFISSVVTDVNDVFDKICRDDIPVLHSRVNSIDNERSEFVQKTVPEAIERQSGEVSRQLKRAYETFEIEKQKEAKREKKLVIRAGKHIQSTAQTFDDEDAMTVSCFYNLEEDIIDEEGRSSRMYFRRLDMCSEAILQLQEQHQTIVTARAIEDADLLDTILETQQLLQKIILEHFGDTEGQINNTVGDRAKTVPGDFPKLDSRMAKIEKRQQEKKGSR